MVVSILTGVCMYVYSAESATSRQHDSVATVGGADMKLGRCVVGTKMQVEFEDGSGTYSRRLLRAQYVNLLIRRNLWRRGCYDPR